MTASFKLDTKGKELLPALEDFFSSILRMDDVSALLIPQQLPMKNMVMPALISEPDRLTGINPLAPAFPINGAKIASKLTRKPHGGKIVAVLRACEIRAFVELVKLHQGATDELIIIGFDCLGALSNKDFFKLAENDIAATTNTFVSTAIQGENDQVGDISLASACKACEQPIPTNADVLIGLYGMIVTDHLLVQPQTPAGEQLTNGLKLSEMEIPSARKDAIDKLLQKRIAFRDAMFEKTREETNTIEKLTTYLGNCVNCYNCRVACPVCYCKECVFVTDVFNHEPSQYLNWSNRKGAIKMPTDTVFYHMTRLAHMSTACVGCGQCTNACPNDIDVMALFRLVSEQTQKGFGYQAGRDLNEKPPLSEFRENEFQEVVGIS